MTPATDDDALEAAFEALLAGRSAPPAARGLVAFTDGVRATAVRPPRPNAALAQLLATGLLTDQSSEPAPRAVRSRRRSTRMFLAFFAKVASAGIAAKAATVAGVVVVGVTTAGFTHSLPQSVQVPFDQIVTHDEPSAPSATDSGTGTSGDDADSSGTATGTATSTAPASPDSDTGDADGSATKAATPPPAVPARQTATPSHPDNFGGAVSAAAHERNDARRAAASSTAPSNGTGEAGDDSATSGKGKGSGSGSGSKGNGHPNG
jgi:hypothetical protein